MAKLNTILTLCALSLAFLSARAQAGSTAEEKCLAKKLKETGKYGFCRMKADSKGVKKGLLPDYDKCESKLRAKWAKIEEKGGCPTNGDVEDLAATKVSTADIVRAQLSGQRFYQPAHGLYVVDTDTDLIWATRVDCGGGVVCTADPTFCSAPLCTGNAHHWSSFGNDPNGTAFEVFLAQLNGQQPSFQRTREGGTTPFEQNCYAGFCDWRLATLGELEQIIISPCVDGWCIDSAFQPFGSPVLNTMSSTSDAGDDSRYRSVRLSDGESAILGSKTADRGLVLAVRGGGELIPSR